MADEKNWDANRKVDAPEATNLGQDDESSQAQTLADEALAARQDSAETTIVEGQGLSDSEKVKTGDADDDVQDIVDHMNQMENSGRIDFDAFRGERNDDDEEGALGKGAIDDRGPRGAE